MIFGNNVFVHIPKTGGQTIYSVLNLERFEHNAKHLHGYGEPELSHLTALEIKSRVPDYDKRFSFTFVRNPWDRLISEYHFRGLPFYKELGFKEIPSIKNLLSKILEVKPTIRQLRHPIYNHFFDQVDFIQDENEQVIVNYIARFENFQNECEKLCNRLGVKYYKKIHRNKSKRFHYSAYYNVETKQMLYDLYKKDIQFFGYEFEEKYKLDNVKLL